MTEFGLRKAERLSGGAVDRVFDGCSRAFADPLRAFYKIADAAEGVPPVRVMVSAPKKLFKRAVRRNRLKRLMREAYRLNKTTLCHAAADAGKQIDIAIVYGSAEVADYKIVEDGVKNILAQIGRRL